MLHDGALYAMCIRTNAQLSSKVPALCTIHAATASHRQCRLHATSHDIYHASRLNQVLPSGKARPYTMQGLGIVYRLNYSLIKRAWITGAFSCTEARSWGRFTGNYRHLSTWRNWLPWGWSRPSGSTEASHGSADSASPDDEFRWMMENPARFQQHLKAEATHCSSVLQHHGVTKLAQQLYNEMRVRQAATEQLSHNQQPPGEVVGRWLYSSSVATGVLLARRPVASASYPDAGQEQVVLNDARLQAAVTAASSSTGLNLVPAIVSLKLSDCHERLAITVPLVRPGWSSELSAALLLDCRTGQLLPGGVVPDVSVVEWCASSDALLVTRPDASGRPYQVWLYKLPQHVAVQQAQRAGAQRQPRSHREAYDATCVHKLLECDDPRVFLSVGRTKDGRFLLIQENTKTSSQVHLMDAHWQGSACPTLRCIQPRMPGLDYFVEHHMGHLLLLTNCTTHMQGQQRAQIAQQRAQSAQQRAQVAQQTRRAQQQQVHQAQAAHLKQEPQNAQQVWHTAQAEHIQEAQQTQSHQPEQYTSSTHTPVDDDGKVPELQLMTVAYGEQADVSAASWVPLALQPPLPAGACINDLDVFDGWCVLYGRSPDGMPAVWVVQLCSDAAGHTPPSSNSMPPSYVDSESIKYTGGSTSMLQASAAPGVNAVHGQRVVEGRNAVQGQRIVGGKSAVQGQRIVGGKSAVQGNRAVEGSNVTQHPDSAVSSAQLSEPGLQTSGCERVPLPAWATHVTPGLNADPTARTLRLVCSSPVHPPHTYDYTVDTADLRLLHVQQVPGGFKGAAGWTDALPRSSGGADFHNAGLQVSTPCNADGQSWPLPASHDAGAYTIKRLWVPVSGSGSPRSSTSTTQCTLRHLNGQIGLDSTGASTISSGKQWVWAQALFQHGVSSTGSVTRTNGKDLVQVHAEAQEGVSSTGLILNPTIGKHWDRVVVHSPGQEASRAYQDYRGYAETQAGLPVTLVYHNSVTAGCSSRLQDQPLLLMGYGAYGQPFDPVWEPTLLPLLERGVIIAYAHVRGGGELGRAWHAAGRGANKQQSVRDFCRAAHALVHAGFSQPGLVAIQAYSAGGLLAGGALSEPRTRSLLACAVLHLAFLDLWSVMSQPGLPLTLHEEDEWGNPNDPKEAQVMQLVCPYHQLGVAMDTAKRAKQCEAADAAMQPAKQPVDLTKESKQRKQGIQFSATLKDHQQQAAGTADGSMLMDQQPGAQRQQAVVMPPILATTAELDTRIAPWVPAKWVARARKLQAQLGGTNDILLHVLRGRGHHADEEQTMQDAALRAAFMLVAWQAQHSRHSQ